MVNVFDLEFDCVLDVGGNIGEFAERARKRWPDALITSFEPVGTLANANWERSHGRWYVDNVAISDKHGEAVINFCKNQHTASTMQQAGTARRRMFGIEDRYEELTVTTRPLDHYANDRVVGRTLLKVDVEGHEREVIAGAYEMLSIVDVVVMEVQNDPDIFLGAPSAKEIDARMQAHGLWFAGVQDALCVAGRCLQFDGIWTRPRMPV